MKVGDLVWHRPECEEMTALLYEAEGLPRDFDLGIVVDVEKDIASTHIQVYADNEIGWYDRSELGKII